MSESSTPIDPLLPIVSRRSPAFRSTCLRTLPLAALALACTLTALPAQAMDMSLSVGRSGRHVVQTELGLIWDTGYHWGNPMNWDLRLYLGAYLGWWHPTSSGGQTVMSIGVSPLARLSKRLSGFTPYFEVSAGPRLLSHTEPAEGHPMSSGFQFAESVGVGAAFGEHRQYQVGYRFEHVSNGGIKEPNPGYNFHQVYFQYHF